MGKMILGTDVLEEAKARIRWTFNNFQKICVSYSGGKDSTVMTHLVLEEARRRRKKVGLLFIDLEAQYKLTISHVAEMFEEYQDIIEPYWICLPMSLRNAVSQYEPKWECWEPGKDWVRLPPKIAITDPEYFPFFYKGMEFEEFTEKFGWWYANGELTASMVGIRADESLNRFRTVANQKKQTYFDKKYTTYKAKTTYAVFPIYDWKTRDIWIYHNKNPEKSYNKLYDRMHQAGLTIHQMRICQPYGDDQRKGLWLFHLIEPETWAKVVSRVNGANQGSLYAKDSGNILGNIKITKPENITWEEFAKRILSSLPEKSKEHFENKILVFLKWWQDRGYPNGIPDVLHRHQETGKDCQRQPSWRRICKALLKNDYWCKGLSFSQNKADAYHKYQKIMKKRRHLWRIKL